MKDTEQRAELSDDLDHRVSTWRAFYAALKSLLCPSRVAFILVIVLLFVVQLARSEEATVISANDASREQVYYYTLRKHTGEKTVDDYYGNARGKARTGQCEVILSPTLYSNITSRLPFYVSSIVKDVETIREFPEEALWKGFRKAADASKANKVVLFVHGYNIDFIKSCSRSALFQQTLDEHSSLLLFSWPSDGTLVGYTRDEADIEWSQPALEKIIRELHSIYGAERVSVVAHSLGARGVVRILQLIAREREEKLINELVLLAPDVDAEFFIEAYPDLKKIIGRITLYSSENDQPLRLSNEVHGYPRLGEAGENLVVLKGMDTIDVSLSGGREMTGHLYHLHNENVRLNIGKLLSTGQTASMRPNMEKVTRDGLPYWLLLPPTE